MTKQQILALMPHMMSKRIKKTSEARSGSEIYKKRNRRDFRVIMQYKIWNNKIQNDPAFLEQFADGYAVMITPEEYFGNNYPDSSGELNPSFVLGETGFIYYGAVNQLETFPPLDVWDNTYEISTQPMHDEEGNLLQTWVGDVVFNVKNKNPKKCSLICSHDTQENKEDFRNTIPQILENFPSLSETSLPKQTGLGNYDYDFATKDMTEKVELQMLYLALKSKLPEGKTLSEYFIENFDEIKNESKDRKIITLIENETYSSQLQTALESLHNLCEENELLNFANLENLGVWDSNLNLPVCPLCKKPIELSQFFEGISQQEGREILDNTQRNIVLMHVKALKPGELNHRIYNLGWGHNFCNLIQGDKDIDETLELIEDIIRSNGYLNI